MVSHPGQQYKQSDSKLTCKLVKQKAFTSITGNFLSHRVHNSIIADLFLAAFVPIRIINENASPLDFDVSTEVSSPEFGARIFSYL